MDSAAPGVTIRDGPRGITFGEIVLGSSGDPYDGDSFVASLFADGLKASATVFMFRDDWPSLLGYFQDLAEGWRGFEGERSYRSIENHLEIRATSDHHGHTRLSFVLREGPYSSWSARLDEIEMAAGEDLTALVKELAAWAPTAQDGGVS